MPLLFTPEGHWQTATGKPSSAKTFRHACNTIHADALPARILYPRILDAWSSGHPSPGKIALFPRDLPALLCLPAIGAVPHADEHTGQTYIHAAIPEAPPTPYYYDPARPSTLQAPHGGRAPRLDSRGARITLQGRRYRMAEVIAAVRHGWPPTMHTWAQIDPVTGALVTPSQAGYLVTLAQPGQPATWAFLTPSEAALSFPGTPLAAHALSYPFHLHYRSNDL